MKRTSFIVFLAVLCFSLEGSEEVTSAIGKRGFPYFDRNGNLGFALTDSQNRIELHNTLAQGTTSIHNLDITSGESFQALSIKKDKHGSLWIIWEKSGFQKNDIYLGRIEGNRIVDVRNLSLELKGINHSPSLDFSISNEKWTCWINYIQGKHRLVVKNTSSGQKWFLSTPNSKPAFTPRILADGWGNVWIFWTGNGKKQDEIFYSFFNGESWKEPESLNENPSVPHFHPSVSLSQRGQPHVVWTAFDGEDYEIFSSSWNGNQWLPEEKITDNKGISDTEPIIATLIQGISVVAWSRSSAEGKQILLKYKERTGWSEERIISEGTRTNHHPFLVTERNQIAVLWHGDNSIFLKRFSYSQLKEGQNPEQTLKKASTSYVPLLEKEFLGFGDSITYGWMYYKPAPEGGYVPRLEVLLEDIFQKPRVLNYGLPGEPTWNAVGRAPAVIASEHSLYFLLMEGTNDVMVVENSMSTSAFNLRQILRKCLEYGRYPLISTIIPRSGGNWTRWNGFFRKRIIRLNKRIARMAQNFGLFLADNFNTFFSYPKKEGGWRSLISDTVHPNEKGYQLMAETWYGKIRIIPFPPEQIKAVKNPAQKTIDLTWDENQRITPESGLVQYNIYRKRKGTKKFSLIATLDSSVFSYQDKTASMFKDYEYALSALNAENIEGPLSKPVTAKPEAAGM